MYCDSCDALVLLKFEAGVRYLSFIKRHCTEVNLVEGGLGRLIPAGLQGWPLKLVKHVADASDVFLSPAGPPGSCPLYLHHLSNLSFMIGMSNRCCILELRANQCFVCNFLSVPRCKGQIAPMKTQCHICLS